MLKARVKQLQATNVPEVTVSKVELAPLGNAKYQDPLQKVVAPSEGGESLDRTSSWVEKLKKEMHIQQLKVEQVSPIAASKLALEAEVEDKVKGKGKGKKSPKTPKTKAVAGWSQGHAGSHGVHAHGKPTVAAGKEAVKVPGRRVPENKESSQVKILQQTIQSNLECFLFLQQPEEAERLLFMYHRSPAKRKVLNVSAYNVVMRSWARKVLSHRLLPWLGLWSLGVCRGQGAGARASCL